jgi:hypothetical protein
MKPTYIIFTLLICIGSLYSKVNLDSGLVAYYPFNGNADDESGYGNNGNVMGAILTEDRFGNPSSAYSFDGVDDYIAYNTLWITPPEELTMVAWFNAMNTEEGKIVYHGDNGEFQLLSINDTSVSAVHLSSDWYFARSSTLTNKWHFLVGIWKKGESLLVYLDNSSHDSITVPDEQLNDVGVNYQPSIGSYNRANGAYFEGYIDDIRIYSRALTPGEIDFLYNEGTSSVEQLGSTIPNGFKLEQNYPNPFNPSTKINFSIPEASFVSLKIFNSIGEEIERLVAEELSAGKYKYDWNAINIPSGIYFYGLQTENFTETKKMILIK